MIVLWSRNFKKSWIGVHEINGMIYGRTRFGIEQLPFLANGAKMLVGVSYVVTKFATMPESMLVYYTTTNKSASAQILL
jgi:hypothetical protein